MQPVSRLTGRLLVNRSPLAKPNQILVAGGTVAVTMVVWGEGVDGSRVAPAVVFDVAIGKGDDSAAIVGAVREIKKAILAHVHTEEGPTDAVGVHVYKGKN